MAIKSTIIPDTTATTSPARLSANTAALAGRIDRGIKFSVASGGGRLFWGPSGVAAATGKELKDGDQIDPGAVEFLGDVYLVSDSTCVFNAEIVAQKVALT